MLRCAAQKKYIGKQSLCNHSERIDHAVLSPNSAITRYTYKYLYYNNIWMGAQQGEICNHSNNGRRYAVRRQYKYIRPLNIKIKIDELFSLAPLLKGVVL